MGQNQPSTALNQEFYNLRNLRFSITIAGLAGPRGSGLIDISIKRNPVYAEKWPGQSIAPSQSYNGENFPDLTLTFFNDSDLNFGNALPNSAITAMELISPNDGDAEFMADLLTYFPWTGWVIGGPDTKLEGKDNSTFSLPIMSNVINRGPGGGFPA